jgi:hypothetical protein
VESGVTGALVDNMNEMAAAITKADSFQGAACVSAARRRFSATRMTDEYLRVYARLSRQTLTQPHVTRAAS